MEFTLDPAGTTTAPDLTAIADPPTAVRGRTLYGQINFRDPFAPGARRASDLDVPNRELKDLTVELRGPDGGVRERLRKFRLTPSDTPAISSRTSTPARSARSGCSTAIAS